MSDRIDLLIACVDYPTEHSHSMQYVHVRNLEYVKNGINVKVLNFSSKEKYLLDGIEVVPLEFVTSDIADFNNYILICHAPNIRMHYRFLQRYGSHFKKIIFFFHGHEIVKTNNLYPKPYNFIKRSLFKRFFVSVYDTVKIYLWRMYFKKRNKASPLVFVSNSLKNDFFQYLNKDEQETLDKRIHIIHNGISLTFERNQYDFNCKKTYDFITIRSNLDSSVYCVDLINEIAKANPDSKFLLIGEGEYFLHNDKAPNIELVLETLNQEDLLGYIDQAKFALMPTRRDSQGVMACELASYGIKVFTSDLNVCHEMFDSFKNTILLSDDEFLRYDFSKEIFVEYKDTNTKFYTANTIKKEIDLINKVCGLKEVLLNAQY